ncbi:GTP-binding protein [Streptomyces sp. NPDC002845]
MGKLSVAIVGGLHADARRAAVEQLLAEVPGSVALHHDLDAAVDGKVLRTVRDRAGLVSTGETPLVNDCACCALREDLVPELERLADSGLTRLAVVELWDSVEPKAMAEVVAAAGLTVTSVITAVDPALLLPYLGNGDDLAEAGLAAAATDQRTVADTFARQLEYAPVLAVADSPEADDEDRALLAQLHPTARQVPIAGGGATDASGDAMPGMDWFTRPNPADTSGSADGSAPGSHPAASQGPWGDTSPAGAHDRFGAASSMGSGSAGTGDTSGVADTPGAGGVVDATGATGTAGASATADATGAGGVVEAAGATGTAGAMGASGTAGATGASGMTGATDVGGTVDAAGAVDASASDADGTGLASAGAGRQGPVGPADPAHPAGLFSPSPLTEAAFAGFDVEAAAAAQHPACALLPTDADECGVSTFVWHRRRPFHPERLYAALEDLTCAAARSRGRFWLADRPDTLLHWDAAGGALCVEAAGPWLASLPDAAWEMVPPVRRAAAALDWHPEHGDCCQHLVFTSPGLDRDGLERLLEHCLLTDAKYAAGRDAWSRLPRPFDTFLEV